MRIPIHGYWLQPRGLHFPLMLALMCCGTPGLSAAPVITGVVNAASYKDPRLPGSSIAPGSIFIVAGSGLGPDDIMIAPAAFQSTNLGGTSVKVTVNGTTMDALMYYTSSTQIAALLPSKTPPGGAGTSDPQAQVTITVTYNGEDSSPTPFQGVVGVDVGLFTVDSSGAGPAIVTYPDYSLVSAVSTTNCGGPNTACGAANAGDTLTLWATGLGSVPGGDGAGSLGQSKPVPLTVWLGGVQAPVIYQGRSGCCIGLDQIVFTVPDNVPTGCAVPLVVQVTNFVSNSTVIPVANGSRECTPADPTVAAANVEQWASLASPTLGMAQADQFPNSGGQGRTERARFKFVQVSIPQFLQPFLVSYLDQPPAGTCAVVPSHDPTVAGTDFPIEGFLGRLNPVPIDAGSRFTLRLPSGIPPALTANSGDWVAITGTAHIGENYAGSYTFTGGPGNDVGAFTAQLTVPSAPTITSPASSAGLIVNKRQGMTVAWNPGGATGSVPLVLRAWTGNQGIYNGALKYTAAVCTVLAGAGTFTIPAYALLALPSTPGTNLSFLSGDMGPAASTLFSASGLNLGIAQVTIVDVSDSGPSRYGFQLQ